MIYLGFQNSFQAGAALVDCGEIIGAVTEERFTRKKDHHGFPFQSIDYVLERAGKNIQDMVDIYREKSDKAQKEVEALRKQKQELVE